MRIPGTRHRDAVVPSGTRARRIGYHLIRALIATVALVSLLLVGLVSLGASVGRFHAVPVDATPPGLHVQRGSLAIITPASPLELHDGDIVVARLPREQHDSLYRVSVDAWSHQVYTTNTQGKVVVLKFARMPARVSRIIPYAGIPFRYLAGTVQGLLLLAAAASLMGLVVVRGVRRRYEAKIAELELIAAGTPARAEGTRRVLPGAWWYSRLAAGVIAMLGVLSLTASATFLGTATVTQGGITAAHMLLTAPGAGATNRLTLGASAIAPGDRMQRALDLTVDSTTSSGVMTGITLLVTASPSSALNTDASNGLRIFIQDCQTNAGASGWGESGTTPAFSYACTKGASGHWNDLLNSSPTDDPTAVPSANTCASSSGGTASYRALSEMSNPSTSTPFTLVNLPLTSGALVASTTIHMVITMCFPTAAGDSFQDATSTFSFAFAGVQRAGTTK